LADHVLREAEYFLQVLDTIQEDLRSIENQPIMTCDF